MRSLLTSRPARFAVFLLCLTPVALLVWRFLHDALGANPVEAITHTTGDWILRFLLLSLAITPLRRLLVWPDLIRYRRMLGLYAFFYACLHFLTWAGFDHTFDWRPMLADFYKRRFITVGIAGLVLMLPLAFTSTKGWIRRLGKRWQLLHRLVYLIAALGVIHYYWLVKSDVRLPLMYGAILVVLLATRWRGRITKSVMVE